MPRPVDIREVAGQLGFEEQHLILHGRYRAKLDLVLLRGGPPRRGKYVLVSAITRAPPSGYTFPIKSMRLAAGAGYLYALAGDIMTIPGLPGHPRATRIDLDDAGEIIGLV